jgi:hypothetical protein
MKMEEYVTSRRLTRTDAYDSFALNQLFSSIFGFAAIQVSLFLITCCVLNWISEDLRYRRIDCKTAFI